MFWSLVVAFSALVRLVAGQSYDQGYWTPSDTTTEWWTPTTTCYTSYYTPTSTYVTVWTQNEVIVTITSYIPCPLTSTVIYYTQTCQQCCSDCYTPPVEPGGGTVTVTSYTTTTPMPVETITSNGLVVVVMDTTSYGQIPATASVQYQVVGGASRPSSCMSWVLYFSVLLTIGVTIML